MTTTKEIKLTLEEIRKTILDVVDEENLAEAARRNGFKTSDEYVLSIIRRYNGCEQ